MHYDFIGICGTAIGNVALMLADMGHRVTGSDQSTYPPMSDRLRDSGVRIREGFSGEKLPGGADYFVIGNAVSRGNPEVEWILREAPERMLSLPELIRRHVVGNRPTAVVSGTHGKTTTTAMSLHLMRNLGIQPGHLIGGVLCSGQSSAGFGDPEAPFLLEGDEYDTAFFDKRSKFISYLPRYLVVHNIEFDHGDIFRDEEDVLRSFTHLLRTVASNGTILYNADDPRCRNILPVDWCHCLGYGWNQAADVQLHLEESGSGSREVILYHQGQVFTRFTLPLPGRFNALNAAASTLLAHFCSGGTMDTQAHPPDFSSFSGVRRRLETRFQEDGLSIIEDFAHHPTAIGQTIGAVREQFPTKELIVCLEPRSNTLTTRHFHGDLVTALQGADLVLLAPVYRAERIEEEKRLRTDLLSEDLDRKGVRAQAFETFEDLDVAVRERMGRLARETVLLVLSNGAMGGCLPGWIDVASSLYKP